MLLINTSFSGYYKVSCEKEDLSKIIVDYQIDTESISVINNKISFIINEIEYSEIKNKYNIELLSENPEFFPKQKYNKLLENGFELGTYGNGYFTLSEIYSNLNKLKDKFIKYNIPTKIDTIGYSINNNPITSIIIGNIENNNGLLLTSLHHAREPASASVVCYFLYDILSQLEEGKSELIDLFDSAYISWVACVNPDGYLKNIASNPNGGGLWRKNTKNIDGNVVGVDLNRNYGPQDCWDSPRGGSSTITYNSTYRGDNPFSEPETQAIRNHVNSYSFSTALNFHSFGNVIVLPSTKNGVLTKDSSYFKDVFSNSKGINEYVHGIDTLTLAYKIRGSSDDYLNSLSPKRIRSVTPEIGDRKDGFYVQNSSELIEQCKKSLPLIFDTWKSINSYLIVKSDSIVIDKKQEGLINIKFKNIGLKPSIQQTISVDYNSKIVEYEIPAIKTGEEYLLGIPHNYISKQRIELSYHNGFEVATSNYFVLYYPEITKVNSFTENECFLYDGNIIINIDSNYFNESNCYSKLNILNPRNNYQYLNYEIKYAIETDFDLSTIELFNNLKWEYFEVKYGIENYGVFGGSSDTIPKYGYHGFEHDYFNETFDLSEIKSDLIELRIGMFSDRSRTFEGISIKNLAIYSDSNYDFTSIVLPINLKVEYINQHLSIKDYNGEVFIYDINGVLIFSTIYNAPFHIDLNKGIYFIKFANNIKKIISL
ncbi:M14 family zinc carboxypeptidase [Candidatus Kapabacteria bacterium]|nr:M14 family zinc carboxypeptidase [Candidatus Kapabacteria bacterium]